MSSAAMALAIGRPECQAKLADLPRDALANRQSG
jgi:hypothetical protein